MSTFHTDNFGTQREVRIEVQRLSNPTATWALLCSIPFFFIPFLPLVGLMLGWGALNRIRQNAAITGATRARLAVGLGFLFTAAQAMLGWQGWLYWQAAQNGPEPAFTAGLTGNVPRFMAQFEPDLPNATPDHAAEFLSELRDRYGGCDDASLILPARWYTSWRPFEPFQYEVQFSRARVRVTAQIVPALELKDLDWQPKLRSVLVHDADRGDLRFPSTGVESAGTDAAAFVDQP